MKIENISIFCGAHEGNNPIYAQEAKNIAEIIARKGINVVFGGGDVGLMKIVSDTALDNGVKALGISLRSLYELELSNPRLDEVIVAETLLDRKDVFMQRSDAFIVLPGGVGSLDELAEVMASNQLGIINKPIGILNTAGYYDHLIAWMNKAVAEGFISDANFNELIITDSCEDLVERIVNEVRPDDSDWTNRLGL
ncbi:MAG: TIGR00730 family Rossman fold protein [SAR86 cluster bacterium]|nr:TIGR00730 family Rossman fold protein [SAR86 cluster bacterium]